MVKRSFSKCFRELYPFPIEPKTNNFIRSFRHLTDVYEIGRSGRDETEVMNLICYSH